MFERKKMIYLASYKGTRPGIHGIVNRGIRLLDHSKYSHTEICTGNPFESEVDCDSASSLDGGVRRKYMRLSPEKWDIVQMPWVSLNVVNNCYEEAKGRKYDYFGVARFALPFATREHPNRDFCSEYGARVAGIDDPWRFSPHALHVACVQLCKIYKA
jgi:hypothetical protein